MGQYNRHGPGGLERRGRGGRRWAYLSRAQAAAFLESFEERAQQGQLLTARQLRRQLCQVTGKKVSLGYLYRLRHRQRWRKLGPRPRHVKASRESPAAFKKNSPGSSRKR